MSNQQAVNKKKKTEALILIAVCHLCEGQNMKYETADKGKPTPPESDNFLQC